MSDEQRSVEVPQVVARRLDAGSSDRSLPRRSSGRSSVTAWCSRPAPVGPPASVQAEVVNCVLGGAPVLEVADPPHHRRELDGASPSSSRPARRGSPKVQPLPDDHPQRQVLHGDPSGSSPGVYSMSSELIDDSSFGMTGPHRRRGEETRWGPSSTTVSSTVTAPHRSRSAWYGVATAVDGGVAPRCGVGGCRGDRRRGRPGDHSSPCPRPTPSTQAAREADPTGIRSTPNGLTTFVRDERQGRCRA